MVATKTCIQIDNNIWNVGGRTMFYASKVEDGRVRVVMYGRVLFMTSEEFARWESAMSLEKNK